MNAKVQETIDNIISCKDSWPENVHYFGRDNRDELIRKHLIPIFQKHSKLEWAFIYKECAKRKDGFYGDLRDVSYTDKDWYDECYRNEEIKKGYYPYIPFEPTEFYQKISRLVERYKIKSFLDVGAGYGDKVLIAKDIVEKADGIEYLKEYVDVAKSFGIDLIHADAFEFSKYGDYDLIYMYHPIHDYKIYTKLVVLLMENMKVGGYLLEVYDPYDDFVKLVDDNKERFNLRIITHSRFNGKLVKKVKSKNG